MSNLTFG